MKHRCFQEIVYYRFLDNESDPEERERVSAHLQGCRSCREFAAQIREENRKIGELFAPAGSVPDLVPGVIEKWAGGKTRHLRNWRLAAAAAFLALGLLLSLLLLQESRPGPQPDRQVVVQSARVQGQAAQAHIFTDKDPDVKFIWLEKI